jgi:hypothetical protein
LTERPPTGSSGAPTASGGDTRSPNGSNARWPTIRASLIAFAILLGAIDGCPLPPDQYVTSAQRPFVDVLRPAQQKVLAPFKWITHGLRFSQRWALMQAAPTQRFRFTVEGRIRNGIGPDGDRIDQHIGGEGTAGTWITLYRANDPDHTDFASILETHHVWGTWNPTDRTMGQYAAFVRWFTSHVIATRADLDAVRVFHEKVIIEDGDVRGTGERTSLMTRERGAR